MLWGVNTNGSGLWHGKGKEEMRARRKISNDIQEEDKTQKETRKRHQEYQEKKEIRQNGKRKRNGKIEMMSSRTRRLSLGTDHKVKMAHQMAIYMGKEIAMQQTAEPPADVLNPRPTFWDKSGSEG